MRTQSFFARPVEHQFRALTAASLIEGLTSEQLLVLRSVTLFDNPLIKPVQMFKAGQILNEMPSSIEPVTWLDAVLETDPGRIFIETPD
ncbi:MAG: hypothetical protein ACREVA_07115, partial [Burkholderiales bacterium]